MRLAPGLQMVRGTAAGLAREPGAALLLLALAATAAGLGASRLWMLLVFAPLFEECVFRAGIQEALLRRAVSPLAANLVTALLFGAAHVLLRGDASASAVALPALAVGAAYGRWRRLRLCVVLHAAMNAAALAWPWLGALAHLGP